MIDLYDQAEQCVMLHSYAHNEKREGGALTCILTVKVGSQADRYCSVGR